MKKKIKRDYAAMGRKRWEGVSARKRSEYARSIGPGRKMSDGPRCLCGENTVARATARAFDCCKRAGLMERAR